MTPSPDPRRIWLSASQIECWRRCQRKWAYEHTTTAERTDSPLALLGTACHAVLEAWLRDGTPLALTTREGQIVMPALPALPQPRTPGLLVEAEMALESDGHWYRGRIDAAWYDCVIGVPHVWDHKTTSNLALAAHTEESLSHATQAVLYAAWAMEYWRADHAEVTFGYLPTSKPYKLVPVSTRITRYDAEKELDLISVSASEIEAAYRSGREVEGYPPSPARCQDYGGCQWRCDLSGTQRMKGYLHMASLMDRIKARQAAQTAPEPVTSPPADIPAAAAAVVEQKLNPPPPAATPPVEERRGPGRPRKDPVPEPIAVPSDPLLAAIAGAVLRSATVEDLLDPEVRKEYLQLVKDIHSALR